MTMLAPHQCGKTTFLYILLDPNTGLIRYLGKADNPFARFRDHCRKIRLRRTATNNWISGLVKKSQRPLMEILDEVPESEWMFWEREYIRVFRAIGIPLLNHTLGGEGGALDAESQARRVATITGRKQTPEHIEKVARAGRGRKRSEETRRKLREALTGRTFSEEHRRNLSLAITGRILSDDHKKALSKSLIGKPKSPAHRAAIAAGNRGKVCSEEHRRRMSETRRGKPWSELRRRRFDLRKGFWHE